MNNDTTLEGSAPTGGFFLAPVEDWDSSVPNVNVPDGQTLSFYQACLRNLEGTAVGPWMMLPSGAGSDHWNSPASL